MKKLLEAWDRFPQTKRTSTLKKLDRCTRNAKRKYDVW